MTGNVPSDKNGELAGEVINAQLVHFRNTEPPCRGVQLPDGVLLRYTQAESLYFYLKTHVENGAIRTQVFASDSPYDRQKSPIGVVGTPMFEHQAEQKHLDKVEQLVREWVDFVKPTRASGREFEHFPFHNRDE